MLRAAVAAEVAGVPSVSLVCAGFEGQARATARGLDVDKLNSFITWMLIAGFLGGPRVALWNAAEILNGNTTGNDPKFLPDFFVFDRGRRAALGPLDAGAAGRFDPGDAVAPVAVGLDHDRERGGRLRRPLLGTAKQTRGLPGQLDPRRHAEPEIPKVLVLPSDRERLGCLRDPDVG